MKLKAPDPQLNASDFIQLADAVWSNKNYNPEKIQEAIHKTLNITYWDQEKLVGSVRILTDGYLFGTLPELMVHPDYQGKGIGKILMEAVKDLSPTGLYFGAQPGKEAFYEKLGFEQSMTAYHFKKSHG